MNFDNTNKGVLFKNRDKESEKHPDFTGTLNIEGVEMNLAAWARKSKKGVGYLSVAISEKKEKRGEHVLTSEEEDKIDLSDIGF